MWECLQVLEERWEAVSVIDVFEDRIISLSDVLVQSSSWYDCLASLEVDVDRHMFRFLDIERLRCVEGRKGVERGGAVSRDCI